MRASLFVFIAACGGAAATKPIVATQKPVVASVTPSASASASVAPLDPHFREHEPELGPPPNFTMPDVRETKLANGIRILSANTSGGMFAMRVSLEGFAAFPSERPAVARVMVKSLFGGTPTEDAHALRRVLEKRFALWSTDTEPDSIAIDMWMPADDMNAVIDTLADVVMHPNFDQQTINFELLQLTEQGQTARESPETLAWRALTRSVFGETHSYARPSNVLDGNPNVDHAEVQRFYDDVADPTTTTIALAGAIDTATFAHVQRAFAGWRAHTHARATPMAPILQQSGPRVVVVDRPGSVQSQIMFGGLAPARSSHDFYAMEMIHELLGAHRSSRLTHALVDRDALSVSGATHLVMHRGEGLFYWSSSVPLDRTADALTVIDKELGALGTTAPTASELDGTKALYLRQIPIHIEGARDLAEIVATIPAFGLPSDALGTLQSNVNAVTPDDVKNLAHARLAPDHTRVIVVGDWAKLKTSLKALAWGAIEVRDGTGKLLRTEK